MCTVGRNPPPMLVQASEIGARRQSAAITRHLVMLGGDRIVFGDSKTLVVQVAESPATAGALTAASALEKQSCPRGVFGRANPGGVRRAHALAAIQIAA